MVVSGKQRITNALLPFQFFETIQEVLGLLLVQFKFRPNRGGIAASKTVFGKLLLFHQPDVAVRFIRGPAKVVDTLDALEECANTFEAIGKFHGDGIEVDAPALLEVGELGDLQTIQQNLPADAPRAESRGFPVVFFKTNVVLFEVDADGTQTLQIEILGINRRRFKDYLKLEMLVEAIGIFAVATVGGPTTGLHVSNAISVGA